MAGSRTVKIVCKTADEAANIQRAIDLPEVRAFLGIVGVMLPLSPRARTRVLTFVRDKLNEENGKVTIETTETEDGRRQHQAEVAADLS